MTQKEYFAVVNELLCDATPIGAYCLGLTAALNDPAGNWPSRALCEQFVQCTDLQQAVHLLAIARFESLRGGVSEPLESMGAEIYDAMIAQAAQWWTEHLVGVPRVEMTHTDYVRGVDGLPQFKALHDECFAEFLNHRDYELSYNQMCQAFFRAVGDRLALRD